MAVNLRSVIGDGIRHGPDEVCLSICHDELKTTENRGQTFRPRCERALLNTRRNRYQFRHSDIRPSPAYHILLSLPSTPSSYTDIFSHSSVRNLDPRVWPSRSLKTYWFYCLRVLPLSREVPGVTENETVRREVAFLLHFKKCFSLADPELRLRQLGVCDGRDVWMLRTPFMSVMLLVAASDTDRRARARNRPVFVHIADLLIQGVTGGMDQTSGECSLC